MRLTKHHGLGNDFLVLLDIEREHPVDAALARAACDRHSGVGADGLVRATPGPPDHDVTMELYNADGGRAEMSGNGVACLAQAVLAAGLVRHDRAVVSTDAGTRTVERVTRMGPRQDRMRVDMGPATFGDEHPEWVGGEVVDAVRVDVGNPHVVLHVPEPGAKVDVEELGRAIDTAVPGGINVEVIRSTPSADELTMAVFERGVGITQACGTGAVAAAAAARAWGLVGGDVNVRMPGGDVRVEIADGTTYLTTIVHDIAVVDFHWP